MRKNFLKRGISLFLVVMLLFTVTLTASAASGKNEKIVARVSYFCYVRSPGHCWIYVENLTSKNLTVGLYKLGPYDGVSVGTFGHTRYDGWGIYYNIEAYAQNTHGLGRYTTLSEELTQSELDVLSNAILSYRNSWSYFRNCTSFAADVWNSVSDTKMSAFILPAFVRISLIFRRYQTNTPVMKPVSKDDVYRQIGNGEDAYLKNVKNSSLRALA